MCPNPQLTDTSRRRIFNTPSPTICKLWVTLSQLAIYLRRIGGRKLPHSEQRPFRTTGGAARYSAVLYPCMIAHAHIHLTVNARVTLSILPTSSSTSGLRDTVYQIAAQKLVHHRGRISIRRFDTLSGVVRMIGRHSSPFADMGASMVAAMSTRPLQPSSSSRSQYLSGISSGPLLNASPATPSISNRPDVGSGIAPPPTIICEPSSAIAEEFK